MVEIIHENVQKLYIKETSPIFVINKDKIVVTNKDS